MQDRRRSAIAVERVIIINRTGTRILPGVGRESSPTPDLTVELCGDFRYRELRIYDQAATIGTLDRIGKHISEILPAYLAEHFISAAREALSTRRPVTYVIRRPSGQPQRITVVAPTPDCFIASIKLLNRETRNHDDGDGDSFGGLPTLQHTRVG